MKSMVWWYLYFASETKLPEFVARIMCGESSRSVPSESRGFLVLNRSAIFYPGVWWGAM